MDFPDTLMLLNRIGVRAVNDVTAQVTAEVTAVMDPEGMGVHMGSGAASASADIEMTIQPDVARGGSSVERGVDEGSLETNQSMYNSMVEWMAKQTANHQELVAKLEATHQELVAKQTANHQVLVAKLEATHKELEELKALAISEAGYNADNRASTQRIGNLLKTNTTKIDSHMKTYLCKVADVEMASNKITTLCEKRMAVQDEQIAQQKRDYANNEENIKKLLTAQMHKNMAKCGKEMDETLAQYQDKTKKSMAQFKTSWNKKYQIEIAQRDALIVQLQGQIAAANALVVSRQNKASSVPKRAAVNTQEQGPVSKKQRPASARTEQ